MATLQPCSEGTAPRRRKRTLRRHFIAGGFISIAVMFALVSTNARANERCLVDTGPERGWSFSGHYAGHYEERPMYPARKVTVKRLERCLSVGANLEARTDRYDGLNEATALHLAAYLDPDRSIVEHLVRAGADVHARTAKGQTPLHLVSRRADPEVVRLLLDAGANVNARDDHGDTALIYAAPRDDAALLRILLDAGANVHARNNSGWTALHSAAFSSGPGAIRTLLEAGAVVKVRSDDGTTPLGSAAIHNEPQAVELLLDHGADPSIPDKEGRFAWDYARLRTAFTGTTTLERLRPSDLGRGCDLFEPHTIATIRTARLRSCLSQGHDVKRTDPLGRSALHHAAIWTEDDAVIETLLKAGADPRAESSSGRTPLHYAAIWNPNTGIVRRLLAQGAPRDTTDYGSMTALDYATLRNTNPEVAKVLLRAGADPQKGFLGIYAPGEQPDLAQWNRDREVAHFHHRAYLEDVVILLRKRVCQIAGENDFHRIRKILKNTGKRYIGEEITIEEAYPYIYCNEPMARNIDLIRVAAEQPWVDIFLAELVWYFTGNVSDKTMFAKLLMCKRDFGDGCLNVFEHIEENRRGSLNNTTITERFDFLKKILRIGLGRIGGPIRDPEFCREVLDEPRYCHTEKLDMCVAVNAARYDDCHRRAGYDECNKVDGCIQKARQRYAACLETIESCR